MRQFNLPSHGENYEFLLRLYFGPGTDHLRLAINRAYLDLSRTVHGLSKHPQRESIVEAVEHLLLSKLPNSVNNVNDQGRFDDYHKKLCQAIIFEFTSREFNKFYVGQAQKWVNMAFKYIFLFPDLRIQYESVYNYCHMPIDSIILACLEVEGLPILLGKDKGWSRLDDYQHYLNYQNQVRDHYPDSALLTVEFHLWQS